MNFVYGVNKDGYIYGRLFKSSKNNGNFVIDAGAEEFSAEGFIVEIWDGQNYISVIADNILVKTKFYGGYARMKQQQII